MINSVSPAIQDFYPPELSHCYGCGRLNPHGLQIKTRWLDDSHQLMLTEFTPQPHHTAIPGFVYGGLLASLIDCHGTGAAAMAAYEKENRPWDSLPANRFVTAALNVNYLLPTPLHNESGSRMGLRLTGACLDLKERRGRVYKVTIQVVVSSELDKYTAERVRGQVVAVQMPDSFGKPG